MLIDNFSMVKTLQTLIDHHDTEIKRLPNLDMLNDSQKSQFYKALSAIELYKKYQNKFMNSSK